ncbi:MAG: TolC family protein [Planctomycetota bacterium]
MNDDKSVSGSGTVFISGLLTLMVLLIVGYAWIPESKKRQDDHAAPPITAGAELSEWYNDAPLALRVDVAQSPQAETSGDVGWESEDIFVEYDPPPQYEGEYTGEVEDSVLEPVASGAFEPVTPQAAESIFSSGVDAANDLPDVAQEVTSLPPAIEAASNDGQNDQLASDYPETEPFEPEVPGWWIAQVEQPMIADRMPVFVSLDEIIFVALQNAPQVHIINAQPRLGETVVREEEAAFDWNSFVESSWNDQNVPVGSTLDNGALSGRFIQREWNVEAGLSRRLLSGGDIRIGQNLGSLDNNGIFLIPPDQGNARLVLDYRQPLMRGRGREIAVSQIALARLDLERTSSTSLRDLQSYLVDVVSAYWDVYFRRATLLQNRRSMERASELYDQLQARSDVDVSNDQLLRAEAALAARQTEVIRSEYELINAQDRLINLSVGPESEGAETIELLTEPLLTDTSLQVSTEQTVQEAIRGRPEIHQAITDIKTATVQQNIAANLLLPQLDGVISSFVTGIRGNKDAGNAFVDQFTRGAPSYTVSMSFEVPIGNRAARSRLERTQLQVEIFRRSFERAVGDVVVDARISARNLQRLNREIENNSFALEKAAEELDLIRQRRRLNLDDGKTGSFYIEDLLASQARLTAAESRLVRSQTELAVALIELKRATGGLLRIGDQTMMMDQAMMIPSTMPMNEAYVQPVSDETLPVDGTPGRNYFGY